MAGKSKYIGRDIREVWNYRLSTATPLLRRDGTWKVEIWAKSNPDVVVVGHEKGPDGQPDKSRPIIDPASIAKPLDVYDTGVPVVYGDEHTSPAIVKAYEWLHSVRDSYAVENIEELKPVVAAIEKKNAELAALNTLLAEKGAK